MTSLQQIEKEALDLPDSERAALAAHLLQTLPGVLSDEDEGVAEALRRGRELDVDPSTSMGWDDLMHEIYVREAIEHGLADGKKGRTKDVKEIRTKYGLAG